MRKFVQPVRVFAPVKVQNELKTELVRMGYNVDSIVIDKNYNLTQLVTYYRGDTQSAGNEQYDFDHNGILVDSSDLFLALAAMSEGSYLHYGEWVSCVNRDSSDLVFGNIYKVFGRHPVADDNVFIDPEWSSGYLEDNFRKATKEEIIDHFETALIASDIPESQRFTIDQAKEIIAKALSIPVEKVEIDGR